MSRSTHEPAGARAHRSPAHNNWRLALTHAESTLRAAEPLSEYPAETEKEE